MRFFYDQNLTKFIDYYDYAIYQSLINLYFIENVILINSNLTIFTFIFPPSFFFDIY